MKENNYTVNRTSNVRMKLEVLRALVIMDGSCFTGRTPEEKRQSEKKAFELTKKAYDSGGLWGSKHLAIYYANGFGVEQNFKEAARIHHDTYKEGGFESTVSQAYYGHCLIRGLGVRQDVDRGFKLLRGACTEKWSVGWALLGDCYRHGYGIEQNYDTAVQHYNRAIEATYGGSVLAHLSLGEMSEAGQGLSQMNHETIYYYKFAAENFNSAALWKLGRMFENGIDVDIDVTRAFEYFKLSARGGYIEAQNTAGGYLGDILERPRISAVATIEEAAERGENVAENNYF